MIFFRTGVAVCVTRDLLFMGVSPLLRGVLGGRFSSNNSGLRWPPKETRLLFKGVPSIISKVMDTNQGNENHTWTDDLFQIAIEDKPVVKLIEPLRTTV